MSTRGKGKKGAARGSRGRVIGKESGRGGSKAGKPVRSPASEDVLAILEDGASTNQFGTDVGCWDDVGGVEETLVSRKRTLDTTLYMVRDTRSEYDIEYDRGHVKKVRKKKPSQISSTASNPFEDGVEKRKKGRGGGRGRGRARGRGGRGRGGRGRGGRGGRGRGGRGRGHSRGRGRGSGRGRGKRGGDG